jgi:hypothetical protein
VSRLKRQHLFVVSPDKTQQEIARYSLKLNCGDHGAESLVGQMSVRSGQGRGPAAALTVMCVPSRLSVH